MFFTISKFFYNNKVKFQENSSLESSSSSEIDNIIQEEEVIFKKNTTFGLLETSKLIDLDIWKRQGDKRKHGKR